MNKGKESYQNIPLPEGLSDAVRDGMKRGRRQMGRKWIIAAGSLAAACAAAVAVFLLLPGERTRTPDTGGRPSTAGLGPDTQGQTPAWPGPDAAQGDTSQDAETNNGPSGNGEAQGGPASEGDSSVSMPETADQPSSLLVNGRVEEISDGQILLGNQDDASTGIPDISLNIGESTVFLDAATLEPRSLTDIKEGDLLYAHVSLIMTRSLPPISNAYAVFVGASSDMAMPSYATVTEISTDDEGNLLLTADQDLILIPGEETVIRTYDGTSLDASDLKVGDRILASYQFVTMSIPAQTNPDFIVLMPEAEGL